MVKSKNENFEVLCISAKLSVAHTHSYLLHCITWPPQADSETNVKFSLI